MFQSGFHRLAFFFTLAAVVVWFYAFNEWWGWLAALLLCIPAGLLTFLIPSMLIGTLRQLGIGDALITWASILGGLAVAAYGVIALEGVTRVVVALLGTSFVWCGISLLSLRMNAMRYRAAKGQASEEDMQFLDDIDQRLR